MPGGVTGGGAAARGGGSGSAFGDYDEEEVAALEAYMKTHPTKEEDKEALRKRARELSASIGSSKVNVRESQVATCALLSLRTYHTNRARDPFGANFLKHYDL